MLEDKWEENYQEAKELAQVYVYDEKRKIQFIICPLEIINQTQITPDIVYRGRSCSTNSAAASARWAASSAF